MERQHLKSVTHKLIFSLLSASFVIFILLSICIFFSSRKYIRDNAFHKASDISFSVIRTLNRKITSIEQIPQTLHSFTDTHRTSGLQFLPAQILHTYPYLSECFISYTPSPAHPASIHAVRTPSDSIICCNGQQPFSADTSCIFRKNTTGGCWSFIQYPQKQHICYCAPLANDIAADGIIGFIFPIDWFIDFAADVKLYTSGHIFFTTTEGETIFCPHPTFQNTLHDYFCHPDGQKIKKAFLQGQTGAITIKQCHLNHFLFYTSIPFLNWRLGLACPYDEILVTSNKFHELLLLICGLALLLLIFITFRIARQISKPLKEFSGYARQIRNGLQSDGISISSNDELGVLKDAFSYLQHNNEKMRNEIRLAQKLQQRFLPYPSPLPENIHVKGELQQSKHVGGDLYEYFLADDHLYFAIGDVAGKGIPAALYMASVVKLFRYVASIQTSTANICNTINIYTAENNEGDMYVTMFVGILNIKTGEMTFTNAGHPEPLIIHANRETSKLTCHHDSPVGLLENYSYSECHYTLPIGTTLLLYTDGITDAENQSGLFYGEEKLKAAIRNSSSLQPNKLVDAILKDLHQHINNAELSDDFTLLAIQLQ